MLWTKIQRFIWSFGEVLVILCILAVMLARNPYSTRTLIPNLEPYPDSIHYLNPARSVAMGGTLNITREGRTLLPVVPPIYSLVMIPGYLINPDVRTFYFTNVALSFVSLFFFYLILQRVFKGQRWLIFSLLFFYVTNHLVGWFPTLAMAENALLPIILAAVYALLLPPSRTTAIVVPMLAVACYATKFASLPIAVTLPLLFAIKLLWQKKNSQLLYLGAYFVGASFIWGGLYLLYDFLVRDGRLLIGLLALFIGVFSPRSITEAVTTDHQQGSMFSVAHADENIRAYFGWLRGQEMTILWKQRALLPAFLAWPALFGFGASLFTRRRWISIIWGSLVLMTILVLMTFYVADGRYLLFALPALITGLGLGCVWLGERWPNYRRQVVTFLPLFLVGIYTLTQATRLKFDVMLNLKYAESPWYYTSVRVFDEYLASHRSEFSQTPVIISALPPYLIDYYAREKFITLPLSPNQEFQQHKLAAWGEHDYFHLHDEFARYLAAGHPVFLTQYGLGNVLDLQNAYRDVLESFEVKKVAEDCHSTCNVYRVLKRKNDPGSQTQIR